jgi:Uncharacterized protein conserved in bacteria
MATLSIPGPFGFYRTTRSSVTVPGANNFSELWSIDPERKVRLRSLCRELMNDLSRLRACYAEPHRAYHTFEHVRSCLELLDAVKRELENPRLMELALWYHDVIYDPRADDNEEQSALMAIKELAELGETPECQQEVARMIRVTEHPSEPQKQFKLLSNMVIILEGSFKQRCLLLWPPHQRLGRADQECGQRDRPRCSLCPTRAAQGADSAGF